jgi:hypothetical protein
MNVFQTSEQATPEKPIIPFFDNSSNTNVLRQKQNSIRRKSTEISPRNDSGKNNFF